MSKHDTFDSDYVFGRTVLNGTEYDALVHLEKPDGRMISGMSAAEMQAVAQVLRAGMKNTELPSDIEERIDNLKRSFDRTKTLQECVEEVGREERARGGI